MNPNIRWRLVELFPLFAFVAYMGAAFLLCFSGLWIVPGWRWGLVAAYVGTALALFSIGYLWKWKAGYGVGKPVKCVGIARRGVLVILALKVLIISLWFVENYSVYGTSFRSVLNPGEAYRAGLGIVAEEALEASNIGRLDVLIAPLWFFALPLSVYWWRTWTIKVRMFIASAILVFLLSNLLLLGRQKAFGDVLIILGSVVLLHAAARRHFLRNIVAAVTLGGVMGFGFMTWNQYSRLETYGALPTYEGVEAMVLNKNHVLFAIFPEDALTASVVTASYFHNGFYGLSFCLQQPFEWTYGVGHSFALMGYADQYFGLNDIIYSTYPLRAEAATGWPSMMLWETIFPWLASDLTFPGTLLFCLILGRFYATTWLEAVRFGNPLSIAMFAVLNIMLVYFPANNQLLQLRESTIGTYGLLLCWIVVHKRLNCQQGQAPRELSSLTNRIRNRSAHFSLIRSNLLNHVKR